MGPDSESISTMGARMKSCIGFVNTRISQYSNTYILLDTCILQYMYLHIIGRYTYLREWGGGGGGIEGKEEDA